MSSPTEGVVQTFQEYVAQVPELVQPLVVAAAAAIPFIEGEVAALIGVVGGLNPFVAAPAAMVGNFLSVTLVVLLGSRARSAVLVRAGRGGPEAVEERRSPRRQKFQRAFERFGVPGVSLAGPLLLPTQFTAAALVSAGVSRNRVLAWQAVAIVLWTSATTAIITGVLSAI